MALIINQRFPLGRFHATRWNLGAFGDAYGEWPPSPWRLLRALVMRWFQYARETGDPDATGRDDLIRLLAGSVPAFSLPSLSWRGPALKQYHPTALEEHYKYKKHPDTKKQVIDYSFRQITTTLTEDNYRVVPPDQSLFWCWENLDLAGPQQQLLDCLLARTLYFGRAESFSRLRRIQALPAGAEINCRLEESDSGAMVPVLVHVPERPLDLSVLLAETDDKELKGRPIPPGTRWFYAKLPRQPGPTLPNVPPVKYRENLSCIQFAVGGHVYPPLRRWLKITERFRGRVIRHLARKLDPASRGRYELLRQKHRQQLAFMIGKDGSGQPVRDHRHAFFLLWPDEDNLPTRLIVWRASPFTQDEVSALLAASEQPVSWDDAAPDWQVRIVPLPFAAPPPRGFCDESRIWTSVTPFVPPPQRRRFRKSGNPRPGESPDLVLIKLLQKVGKPEPTSVDLFGDQSQSAWVNLHETRERRLLRRASRTQWARPGFRLRIEFDKPVVGPLVLGDSCHFGVGIFAAEHSQ